MIKRIFDILFSVFAIFIFSPLLLVGILIIWMQDFKNPFYVSERVGINSNKFKFIKLRSMTEGADKSGVDSTSINDQRITPVGKFIRKFKLDELPQFINVLSNTMSIVGPRPNIAKEVATYSQVEKRLLDVKPGITDIASIVFSDEGDILANSLDPDLDYQKLIRPGKSALGIFYINNQSFLLDIKLILLTIVAIFSKQLSRKWLSYLLTNLNADQSLVILSRREKPLTSIQIYDKY